MVGGTPSQLSLWVFISSPAPAYLVDSLLKTLCTSRINEAKNNLQRAKQRTPGQCPSSSNQAASASSGSPGSVPLYNYFPERWRTAEAQASGISSTPLLADLQGRYQPCHLARLYDALAEFRVSHTLFDIRHTVSHAYWSYRGWSWWLYRTRSNSWASSTAIEVSVSCNFSMVSTRFCDFG